MKTKVAWQKSEGRYVSGHDAMVGKWRVGQVEYDSCRSRDEDKMYRATCLLPGIKSSLGHHKDESAAKAKVEFAVAYWFEGLGNE